jgi:hypothetical protein
MPRHKADKPQPKSFSPTDESGQRFFDSVIRWQFLSVGKNLCFFCTDSTLEILAVAERKFTATG